MKKTQIIMNLTYLSGIVNSRYNKYEERRISFVWNVCMSFGKTNQYQNIMKKQNCYMVTDSFIFHAETEDIYKDISKDVEKGFQIMKQIDCCL